MNFIVRFEKDGIQRANVLHEWSQLDHLVNTLNVKEFSIEVFEYTKEFKNVAR